MFKLKQVHDVQLKQTQDPYNNVGRGSSQKLNKFDTLRFMVLDYISMV